MHAARTLLCAAAFTGCAADALAQQWTESDAAVFSQLVSTEAAPAGDGETASPLLAAGDNDGGGIRASLASDCFERLTPSTTRVSGFPLAAGRTVALQVRSFQVTGPGATIVEGTDAGDVPLPMPPVTLFRGEVEGAPGSWVFLGVTPGRINGILHLGDDEEYIVAPLNERIAAGAADTHVIFERFGTDADSPPSNFHCTTALRAGAPEKHPSSLGFETPPGGAAPDDPDGGIVLRGASSHVCWLAIDCDWEYRNLPSFASTSDAAAYALELIGVVNMIYERDVETRMYVNFLRVWNTAADPYDADDTLEQLPEFENYFSNNLSSSTSREVNHLLSGRDLGGGRAFLDVLCDGYGVSGDIRGTFPRPAHDYDDNNWDIIVIPHEIGHNFGSPHTHCYDPPIDTCAGTGYDCAHPQVCQRSELMSYCHLCPGGKANIRLAFVHPAVLAEMREDVSCLRVIRPIVYVLGSWHGAENGNQPTPYNNMMKAFMGVSEGGVIRVRQGTYPTPIVLDRAVRVEVWDNTGLVRIGG